MTVLLNLVVAVGMLFVVPLGLRLLDDVPAWLWRGWPVAGLAGAVSLWVPRGPAAVALAAPYVLLAGVLALIGLLRLLGPGGAPPGPGWPASGVAAGPALGVGRPAEAGRVGAARWLPWFTARAVAEFTALVSPAVAGLALAGERGGWPVFGFELPVLALTVAHFHFAGFAAALVAGLVSGAAPGRVATGAALSVPIGTGVVLLGFFVSEWVELTGALILTGGLWAVAGLTWSRIRPTVASPTVRALLAVAAIVPVGSMLLALSWALGEATGLPHPSLAWMIATHGVANAFGFTCCALLAWYRLKRGPQWTN